MKPQQGEKQAEKSSSIKVGKDSGRVKVFVRVRPPRPHENSRKEPMAVNVQELSSRIHVSDPKHSWEKTFNFDHVFPQESTNPEVCSTISRPLVNAALNGFNGTLMAYGQTGSGKTHTLMAPDGITAGVIERCFKKITQDERHEYKVTMSYLQIYQEKIYDLLNSTNKVELSLREHPVKGVYVENLSEFVVRSPSEVLSLLAVGKKRLVFAETKMNRNSSRSHSVCQLTIERTLTKNQTQTEGCGKTASSQERDSKEGVAAGVVKDSEGTDTEDDSIAKMVALNDDVLIRGRIYLCDLAGSERLKKTQAEGERLSEAQHINSSLLELGNVIQALAEGKKTHVPFRNSTLTRLLQESLGGNCKTSLVVCVSPSMGDVSETKSALFFGSRAMKITNTAYINVEVDYKRLSEDLSKIVDMREKDMEELKQSYENRIERIKHEAETTVGNTMAEADKVVASVKSLYENQQSSFQSDIESLNSSLEEERACTANLQGELTVTKSKLEEDMFRARSTLLMDIISMQLFYGVKELSLDDAPVLPENESSVKCLKDGYIQSVATTSKLLENTDLLLELFKGYLKMMNSKGEKLLENSGSLRFLIGTEEFLEEPSVLCETEDESLYLTNKTDDDKVVASLRCNETPLESHNKVIGSKEIRDNDEYSSLRDKLVSLKNIIDDEALDFMKRAFEFDGDSIDQASRARRDIYERIQEFLEKRAAVPDGQRDSNLPCVADTLALLDHCHSHVIVDKALQSALLVLENNNVKRRCYDIQMQKNVLEDQNEALQKQIQSLKSEVEKLNGKLNETSTKLCDVKESKERLEDDLSSVFQLYNMRNGEEATEEEVGVDNSLCPDKLQAQILTLVENNEKLQEELAVKEQETENLKCELTSVKGPPRSLWDKMKLRTHKPSQEKNPG